MRPLILISAALVWAGCGTEAAPQPPPIDRFVYPSGIVHRQVNGSPNGALYVASANFDKCYDTGAVVALDLDSLGLPEMGADVPASGPPEIDDLKTTSDSSVYIDSFAGQMALATLEDGTQRLFVPTRAESNYLHAINIQNTGDEKPLLLKCVGATQDGRNCLSNALSLTSNISGSVDGEPRAPAPIGVTVDQVGGKPELWVTHTEAADSPARSTKNPQTYLVHIKDAGESPLSLKSDDFVPLAVGSLSISGAQATAIGDRYVYVTGRNYTIGANSLPAGFLLRLVDRTDTTRLLDTTLGTTFQTLEARDIVRVPLGKPSEHLDKDRLYILARAPDTLLVVDVDNASSARPTFLVVDAVPLPQGASTLQILSRGDPGDELVAVTCTATTLTLGVVVLYDVRLGQVVRQVGDVGTQPFGLAVDQRGDDSARLYVTNFGDGRIAVIDIPSINQPQEARLVAYLGQPQGLDAKQGTSACRQETQP